MKFLYNSKCHCVHFRLAPARRQLCCTFHTYLGQLWQAQSCRSTRKLTAAVALARSCPDIKARRRDRSPTHAATVWSGDQVRSAVAGAASSCQRCPQNTVRTNASLMPLNKGHEESAITVTLSCSPRLHFTCTRMTSSVSIRHGTYMLRSGGTSSKTEMFHAHI